MREKQKKLLNYFKKTLFRCKTQIFSHVYALAANQSSKEELVKNAGFFFRYSLAVTKGLITSQRAIWIKFRDLHS